ncbi:MAG: hypothetical protein AAGK74_00310 [Chloroflexota bacterium]
MMDHQLRVHISRLITRARMGSPNAQRILLRVTDRQWDIVLAGDSPAVGSPYWLMLHALKVAASEDEVDRALSICRSEKHWRFIRSGFWGRRV